MVAQLKRHTTYSNEWQEFSRRAVAHTRHNIQYSLFALPETAHESRHQVQNRIRKLNKNLLLLFRRVVDVSLFDCLIVSFEFSRLATDFSTRNFRMWQASEHWHS